MPPTENRDVDAPALELRGIDKRFGAVYANRLVNLRVARGSIHGLIGENGAGKTTLMNIAYGLHPPDRGEILVHGRQVEVPSPQAAIRAGIGMVHQHFMLVENFTALENVVLGVEGGATLKDGLASARTALRRLADDYGLGVPLDVPVGELPVGEQQRIEILKALYRRAEILVLDEPTAVLTPQEAESLFRMLRKLRDEEKSVILVTHKLREIMAVTDRVTVMRQGSVVADVPTSSTSTSDLAEKMVGRPVLLRVAKSARAPGGPRLRVANLEVRDERGVARIRDVSFHVGAGEIVGIAGVTGNGQSELLEAIAGVREPTRGSISIDGVELPRRELDGGTRRKLGLAHIPEDRLRTAVVRGFSAEENAILGYHDLPEYQRGGLLDRAAVRGACEAKMTGHDIRPRAPGLPIESFSGGNQQKLVVAREVDPGPSVLVVGQPTRGVDIGAIESIHRRLIGLRDAGAAVLLVSVELEEVLSLSDRILVMHAGEVVGEVRPGDVSEEQLGLMMAGLKGAQT